jgi:hypothetical protein
MDSNVAAREAEMRNPHSVLIDDLKVDGKNNINIHLKEMVCVCVRIRLDSMVRDGELKFSIT